MKSGWAEDDNKLVELFFVDGKFMMKTTRLYLILMISLILAACSSGAVESEPTEALPDAAAPTATLPIEVEETATVEIPAAAEAPPETDIRMDGCTLQTLLEAPDATEASQFPAVSDQDWVQGPENAATTIIEYGDFQ